jgi:ribosome assembly protein SQT1
VSDAAVIPVPDDAAGEVPKAFVVKTKDVGTPASPETDRQLASELQKYVEEHKARYKWLKGGIEFIEVVPKGPSGKILRRLLRDNEMENRKKAAMAKL